MKNSNLTASFFVSRLKIADKENVFLAALFIPKVRYYYLL